MWTVKLLKINNQFYDQFNRVTAVYTTKSVLCVYFDKTSYR